MKIKHTKEENGTTKLSSPSLSPIKKQPITKNPECLDVPDNISEIAMIVRADWKNIYFGAIPYLDAMTAIENIESDYYEESAKTIVSYFLSNAQTWRGGTAKLVKTKLKELLSKIK